MKLFRKVFLFGLIVGSIFLLDLFTKQWAFEHLPHMADPYYPYGGKALYEGLFGGIDIALVYRINPGMAWSFFSEYPHILFWLRIVIAAIIALIYFISSRRFLEKVGLLFILGGALGNIADYIRYGAVVDMIKVTFWGWHYPVFNIADAAVVCGVILYLMSPRSSKR